MLLNSYPKSISLDFRVTLIFAPIILVCDEVCKYVRSHFVRSDYINIVACTWSYAHSHTPYYTCTHTHTHTHMLTYKHLLFSSQVCGGNFKPTVHHLTTLTKTVVLPVTGTTYTAKFHGDRVSIHTYIHIHSVKLVCAYSMYSNHSCSHKPALRSIILIP